MSGVCQGLVVQSIVSLTSSSVVKMLSVLVSTISNLKVFMLKILAYIKYQILNDTSTNDIVSFEQLDLNFK